MLAVAMIAGLLMGCGKTANLKTRSNVEPNVIVEVMATPTSTTTPSPTPIPTNPFGEAPIEGYESIEKYQNIDMLNLPYEFDRDAYYDYLRYKYGWTQDDYFYRHPD
jgi:hypothetical protein